ncbi:MAG: hypothetical protein MI923_23120 [Phycisphaerales bacterium]|nr:hypothetical protein [Phycisphaerales bacterium]
MFANRQAADKLTYDLRSRAKPGQRSILGHAARLQPRSLTPHSRGDLCLLVKELANGATPRSWPKTTSGFRQRANELI